VGLSTHSEGGITNRDLALAGEIESAAGAGA
jgi:pterin-4a-carbinolamine dehydratase